MKWFKILWAGGCLAIVVTAALGQSPQLGSCAGQGPGCATPYLAWPVPPGTTPPATTPPSTTPGAEQPSAQPESSLAQAPEAGTQGPASVAPTMFGDQLGGFTGGGGVGGGFGQFGIQGAITGITAATGATGATGGVPNPGPGFAFRGQTFRRNIAAVVAPVPLHASYKITENESPMTQDRAYISYNYYDDVTRAFHALGLGEADFNRETLGVEGAFDGGNASLGLRLPFAQLTGDETLQDSLVGDLTINYKYLLIHDRQAGNVLCTGLALTVPTGQALHIDGESAIRDTVFQPFLGYIYNCQGFYVEGFSSVAVPTDARDVTLLFNSVALGCYAYRSDGGDGVRAITPQVEVHVNTPLSHRGLTSTPIGYPDDVNLIGGVRVWCRRVEVGAAAGAPITGPRPYGMEANANVAWHF